MAPTEVMVVAMGVVTVILGLLVETVTEVVKMETDIPDKEDLPRVATVMVTEHQLIVAKVHTVDQVDRVVA